jgi:hypothetical protein
MSNPRVANVTTRGKTFLGMINLDSTEIRTSTCRFRSNNVGSAVAGGHRRACAHPGRQSGTELASVGLVLAPRPRNFASHDTAPLQNPWWNPVWDAVVPTGLPMDFHTI